MAMMTDYSY